MSSNIQVSYLFDLFDCIKFIYLFFTFTWYWLTSAWIVKYLSNKCDLQLDFCNDQPLNSPRRFQVVLYIHEFCCNLSFMQHSTCNFVCDICGRVAFTYSSHDFSYFSSHRRSRLLRQLMCGMSGRQTDGSSLSIYIPRGTIHTTVNMFRVYICISK